MSIIGIILGVLAIGLIFWFKKNQDFNDIFTGGEIGNLQKGYKALMEEFTNYQITNERKIAELEKAMEVRFKSRDRQIDAASKRMDQMNKSLPSLIKTVIGHIEFAQPLDKK